MTDNLNPSGWTRVELEIQIQAPAVVVWRALVEDAAKWWRKDFYATENPDAFVFEARVGGRVFEDCGDRGGLLWYTVTALQPPTSMNLVGHLSPPYAGPATSHLYLLIEERDGGSVLKVTDAIVGNVNENTQASVQEGWQLMFADSFKAHAEALSS